MKQIICCSFLLFFLGPLTFAGELILTNGDRLEGEFVRVQGENLVWKSTTAGELEVNTSEVDSVQSSMAFKLDGHDKPCYWISMEKGLVHFQCDDGDSGVVNLMSLNMVIPYPQYAGGHYTYRGKLTLSGRRASGNKEEELWAVDSETLFRRGDYRHQTEIEFDSISQNGQSARSQGKFRYSLDWFFEEQWFWYNNLRFGFDEPASIDESYVYGTGVGYQVWETSDTALSVEAGFDYVKEHFNAPAMPTPEFEAVNTTAAWRWALDFRYVLPRNSSLFHRHQLTKSFEQSNDWRLETQTGISLPVTGQLYSEIKLDYDVDNLPVEGSVREDKQITIGVGYSW